MASVEMKKAARAAPASPRPVEWIRPYRQALSILVVAFALMAATAPVAASAPDASSAAAFLLKPGEMGQFTPGRPQVFRTAAALERASEDSPKQVRLRIRRYKAEGFVQGATVRLHDKADPSAKGISSVSEFETPTGAKVEMRAELKEELDLRTLRKKGGLKYLRLRHFRVPGVPNAVAFAFLSDRAAGRLGLEAGFAKGMFVEGSCLLAVGDGSLTSNEVTEPVIDGVQAISERTAGNCP
jgi:hypothetical protein